MNFFNKTRPEQIPVYKKLPAILRITTLALLVCSMHISASVYSQKIKLSLNIRNQSIKEVLYQIENQSEFRFIYESDKINLDKNVSIQAKEQTVETILNQLFGKEGIKYEITENNLVLINPADKNKNEASVSGKVSQEKRTITGTVTDEQGEPIVGANVVEKGTTNGVITDVKGGFSLSVKDKVVLQVTYIGYVGQEISVSGQSQISVTLKEDSQNLEEVVVVGYGKQKKISLTGSVASVKGAEITKSPSMNVMNSLTGRLPGVIINSRADEPGRENMSILIRGRSTMGKHTSPLYIIDGVERGTLGQLNPQDIENITVLKDASAAIYGARSANGVILVTTKRGALGKPTISLTFNQGFTQPTRSPKMGDSYTFAKIWNETLEYDGQAPQFTQTELDKYRDGTDPNYPNTDWYDVMVRDLTPQRRTDISVSGGNERVKYYVSLGEAMQKGHFNFGNTKTQQYSVRSNIDFKINDWIQMKLDLSGRQNNKNYPWFSTNEIYSHLFLNFPTYQPYWPGTKHLSPGRDSDNLINLVGEAGGFDRQKIQNFEGTLSATVKVPWVTGLSLSVSGSFDTDNNFTKRFQQPTYVYQKDPATDELVEVRAGRGVDKAELSDRIDRASMQYLNARINYERQFNVHNVGIMAGYEQRQRQGNYVQAGRSDYISTTLPEIILGSPDPMKWGTDGNSSKEASQSVFGRLNYEYASKYLAQATFRYDGSTFFPKEKRFGFFPSVSVGWRVSEEPFMKQIHFLDNLKIRASYGEMGNDRVDPYQYLTMYDSGKDYVIGGKDVSGIMPSNVANPNITWEIAKTANLGFESTLWNGLLGVEFDYFKTKRSNILTQRNAVVPNYTGLSLRLPYENIGRMQNQGFELVLSHINNKETVKYSLTGNLSYARNKILFKDEVPAAEPYQLETGHPWGSGLYYKYMGVFQNQEQLESYPQMAGYGLGDAKYEDVNKDGVIDSKDRVRLDRNLTPEIVFSLNATASYKGFDLSVLFQGQANAARSMDGFNVELNYGWGNFYQFVADDRWSLDNPNGTKPRANNILFRNQEANTLWYVNAAFLRLKNVELGYTLPQSISEMAGLGAVRFVASAYNLCLLFDSMKEWGLDPEQDAPWGGGYSLQRTFNFGVNVTF